MVDRGGTREKQTSPLSRADVDRSIPLTGRRRWVGWGCGEWGTVQWVVVGGESERNVRDCMRVNRSERIGIN